MRIIFTRCMQASGRPMQKQTWEGLTQPLHIQNIGLQEKYIQKQIQRYRNIRNWNEVDNHLFFWPPLQVGADGQSLAAQSGLSSAEKDDQKSWKKYLNFERQRRCCKKRQRRLSCEMLQCCRPAMRCELLSKVVKYFAKHVLQSAAKYFRLVLQNCHSMSCKWSHHKNCCTDVRVKKRHWWCQTNLGCLQIWCSCKTIVWQSLIDCFKTGATTTSFVEKCAWMIHKNLMRMST